MPRTARTLYQLILDRLNGGDLEEAKSFFGSFKKLSGGLFREEGKIYVLLGRDCLDKGKLDEAEEYFNNSLKIFQILFGENNLRVTINHSLLGLVCLTQGKLGEAKKHFQLFFPKEPAPPPFQEGYKKACRRSFDKASFEFALNCRNFGRVCQAKGDEGRAVNCSEKPLRTYQLSFAGSCRDLGIMYQVEGNFVQAALYLEKSLETYEIINSKPCPMKAVIYNQLGKLYLKKDPSQAVKYFDKCLKCNQVIFGKGHSLETDDHKNLGLAHLENGNVDLAFKHLKQASNKALTLYEKDHLIPD